MVGRDHTHTSYNVLIYLARQQTSIKYVKMAFLLSFSTFWTQSATLNMPAYLENSAVATGLEKVIPVPKKGNANAQTTTQLY